MNQKIIIGIMASFISAPAMSYTGNDLMKWAPDYEKMPSGWNGGLLSGYISGVAEVTSGILYCPAPGVTHAQNTAIVLKFLRNNPERWTDEAPRLVVDALVAGHQACPKSK